MRAALAAAWFAAVPALCAPSDGLRDLKAGQYELKVSGLLCWACARAVAQELSSLKGVERASADFDRQSIELEVKSGAKVKASKIRKALSRAEKLANLGGHYEVTEIAYRLVPIIPGVPDGLDKSKARR